MRLKALLRRFSSRACREDANFRREFDRFNELSRGSDARFDVQWNDRFPILNEKTVTTGFDRHYVYHTAWAARVVAGLRPVEHTDISSSLYFSAIVSAFTPVKFYDYRPADLHLNNLHAAAGDLLNLPFPDRSIRSLSCMHVVEHVGLGRYGDPLDPIGDLKAMRELLRVLAPGGSLIFVVPVGKPRLCFNAHRVYSLQQIRESFACLDLKEFSLVPDDPSAGGLLLNPSAHLVNSQNYGCGCFWFTRGLST